MTLKQDVTVIIDKLGSTKPQEINSGLSLLDKCLRNLVPSLRRVQSSGTIDARLSAFVSLQESFHYNLVNAMISIYHTNAFIRNSSSLIWANSLLCGLLLIHPDSRHLFSTTSNMLLMLLFLDPSHHLYLSETCGSFVSLMIHILLKIPKNMRVFEQCGGCLIIIRLLQLSPGYDDSNDENPQSSASQQTVYFKLVEFLIFYMTDEPDINDPSVPLLSVREKADLFRPDFPAIEELVDNLNNLSTMR